MGTDSDSVTTAADTAADRAWDGLQQMWGELTAVVRSDAREIGRAHV